MKRILLSLAAIAVSALVATSATWAYFSDNTSALTGVTFLTGNADLRISQSCMHQWFDGSVSLDTLNNGMYAGCQFNLNQQPWYPGETQSAIMYLGNFSTSNIALTPTFQLQNYHESGAAGLDNVMQMKIWWSGSATGTGWHTLSYYLTHSVSLPNIAHPTASPPDETNGGVLGLNVDMQMSPNAGSQYQNGTATFDFHFDAAQVH